MGNFEKLSVLVIVVIIVMILVVALYTWTDSGDSASSTVASSTDVIPLDDPPPPAPDRSKKKEGAKDDAKGGAKDFDLFGGSNPFKDWPLPKASKEEKAPAPSSEGGIPVPTPPPAPAGPQFVDRVVKEGETLGQIAKEMLGSSSKWPDIVKANPGLDPLRVRAGTTIRVPLKGTTPDAGGEKALASGGGASGGSAKAGGPYSVLRGETLETISKKVYGTKNRWPEIWVANLALLDDPSDIRQGMTLQLPK
jgi:nucleoid-associated protein YgaU